jgi:hypothetical protein
MKLIQLLVTITLSINFLQATFDLNHHHLLFIADHLTNEECRKLIEMLNINADDEDADISNEFNLSINKEQKRTFQMNISTSSLPDDKKMSCYEKLVDWNTRDGSQKTFHHLKRQLEMLDRNDIAIKLGIEVNKEVVHDLKYFLFDRFNLNKIPGENVNKNDDKIKPIADENDLNAMFSNIPNNLSSSFHDYFKKFIFISILFIISFSMLIIFLVACVFMIRSRYKN